MRRTRVGVVLALTLVMSACSPAQRRVAGAGLMGFGAGTVGLGGIALDPCGLEDGHNERRCRLDHPRVNPGLGETMMASGAVFVAIGAIVYATTLQWRPPTPRSWRLKRSPTAAP